MSNVVLQNVVLQTEGLTKRFGDLTAIQDLSLKIYEGEVFGFLGPNGAGKTTSINMICGLLKPDAGQVLVQGKPIHNGDNQIRTKVGVCPQDIVLWERLTCIEQLQFISQMYGVDKQLARQRSEQVLEDLGLTAKRKVQARALSGGMKRRLNLAMALVHDPEIIVLDEPEAGLDPQSRIKVREYIKSLARHKTIILTTHNMDEADRMADRIAIIDHGELLVLDTPEALKQSVGEGDVVEIDLDGVCEHEEQVVAEVKPLVSQVSLDSKRHQLTVRALNAVSALPAILDTLEANGLQASDVRVRKNSLEDVFIQLTGRRLRE
ncbi:MAG: ABC transporter ATP-binding protein [Chloroflexi bacterium]|nr:MAG: ABC transporter ATP-binding protein [Chloroflexota bacterium]